MMMSESLAMVRPPHWSEGIGEWASNLDRSARILLASDFDGTLSPLVRRPPDAELHSVAREWLERIQRAQPRAILAILSGRGLRDLSARLGSFARSVILAGNHGLEIQGLGFDWTHPEVAAMRPALDHLGHQLDQMFADIPGIEIEDKRLSLTLHYRRLDPGLVTALGEKIGALPLPEGIRLHEGKLVFEFRPDVSWNKGKAIRAILGWLEIPDTAAVYFGDDVTDEDVFQELGEGAFTVHVGEAPTRARFAANDPSDVACCLGALHRVLAPT